VVYIPGIVQVVINTYSESLNLFFLTLQVDGSNNNIVVVDVVKGSILSNVNVDPAIEILAFDDKRKVLYAWVATEDFAGELVSVDYMTGIVIESFVSSVDLSANGGVALVDPSTNTIYSSLLQYMNEDDPYWTIVDLNNYPNCTLTKIEIGMDVKFPWYLGISFSQN